VEGAGEVGGEGTHDVPGCYSAQMKTALAILAAILLLAGCGQANAPKDPFVGTWRGTAVSDDPNGHLVIARVPNGYLVAITLDGHTMGTDVFARQGNKLVAAVKESGEPGGVLRMGITYLPGTGRVSWKYGNGLPAELVRISNSTEIPSPSAS
jgi:hypothetical protein